MVLVRVALWTLVDSVVFGSNPSDVVVDGVASEVVWRVASAPPRSRFRGSRCRFRDAWVGHARGGRNVWIRP